MNLARIGVKYPITTSMFFIALVLIGAYSISFLGLDLMPEIEIPAISVSTAYPGAAPEEVENEVTRILERYLSTVADLDELESSSQENFSVITLKFDWGIDLNEASNDVRDKIDLARRELPDDADDPVIFKFDLSMIPVLILGVTADTSLPDLYDISEDYICNRLEAVPGVAAAIIRGGDKRQLNLRLNLDKLNAYGVGITQIEEALRRANLTLPSGHLKSGQLEFLVRVPGKIELSEFGDILIKKHQERQVYLKDIADIEFGFQEKTREVNIDRRPGMVIMVQKRSGQNTVDVVRQIRRELPGIQQTLPDDIKLYVIRDFSEFIELTISSLRQALLWGGLLVALIVVFFIGSISSALIIITALPTCLLIAFLLLYLGGYTLNIISLSSLAIALGLVIDASIVVLDNISRKKEQLMDSHSAVLQGTGEVARPVTASVLTTVVVFFPVLFMGGITGIMFRQMAYVIMVTLGVSLLNALWLIPMLSARIKHDIKPKAGVSRKFMQAGKKMLDFLELKYEKSLRRVLVRPKLYLLISGGVFIISILLFRFVRTGFMAEADSDMFIVNVELPLGARMEATGEAVKNLAGVIEEEVPEKSVSFELWGYEHEHAGVTAQEGSHTGRVGVRLISKSQRKRSVFAIVDDLRARTRDIPGARLRFDTQDPLSTLMGAGAVPLVVELYGHNLELAGEYAEKIAAALESIPGIEDVDISRKIGSPEIYIDIDRQKAQSLGFTVHEIAHTLRTLFQGNNVTSYTFQGRDYDINIRLSQAERNNLDVLERIFLYTPAGSPIKINEFVDIGFGLGPTQIERKNQQRLVKVSARFSQISLGQAAERVFEKLQQIELPPGLRFILAGEYKEQQEAFSAMKWAALLALILVYMVLASQFESLMHPLFIIFTIPFAFVGVVLLFLITRTIFSVDSFLGIIMLVGIVVNNAIVLVSYMNLIKAKQDSVLETIILAGKRRLRPIIMTSLTTICAMLPLSLFAGQGAEYWRPFSNAIIGGLAVSFIITLYLIPIIYYLYERRKSPVLAKD